MLRWPAEVRRDITELRHLSGAAFGINMIVPEQISLNGTSLDDYRELLHKDALAYPQIADAVHETPVAKDVTGQLAPVSAHE
ncbi:hypothetical protein AB0M22_17075 [Nocardia sp. NPDC051756]|uniref:hypothetical protein n=1 Tax=Nocardia sp. NPDC051756 TaxID=3154751 RepID=UPI003439B242